MDQLKIPKAGEGETIHREPVKSNRFVDRDTILIFYGRLEEAAAAKKAASKIEAGSRKTFKNTGVSLGIFDTRVRLSQQEDADAVQKFFDEFVYLADVFAQPVGAQLGLFEGAGNTQDAMKRAYQTGYDLSLRGKNKDDQAYPENTDLGQEHYRGWQDGQTKRGKEFIAYNEQVRQAEAEKKAKAEDAAKRKADRAAKAAEKAGRTVPKTEGGETGN